MGNARWLMVVVGTLLISACGGDSGSGGGGSQIAQASADEFEVIMELCFSNSLNAQTIKKTSEGTKATTSCDCPGGGTASLNSDTYVATMSDCKSSNGYVYTGTIAFDPAVGDITISFAPFGGCASIAGQEIISSGDTCTGSLGGTCGSDHVECDFVSDGDNCGLDC